VGRTERRTQLLDAAARAIRNHGVGVSMEALAAEAGVTKPVLYAHFGDKAGLTRALADRFTNEIGARLLTVLAEQRDEKAMLRAAIEGFMAMVETEPQVYQFMLQHGLGGDTDTSQQRVVFNQLGGQIARLIELALRQIGDNARSARPWAFAMLGAMLSTADWWLRDPRMARADLVDDLTNLFWNGLAAGAVTIEASRADGTAP
jgi:AcrR family transcriptional regulator